MRQALTLDTNSGGITSLIMASNQYLEELYKLCLNRYAIETDDMTMGAWMCANTHLRGKPFSFSRYPFQEAIADDMHPNLCCRKISQIGLTEVQIRKILGFLTRNRATVGLYSFPDDDMRKRNSQTRIQPLLDTEHVFNLDQGMANLPIRSIALIQLALSFLHVTGSKEGDATSTSADIMFNDEIDLTDQKMLGLFESRLQGSDWKIRQQFSTPTYSGFGIDLLYSNSDQMEYQIKCDACNHWQYPMFTPAFIDIPGLPSDLGDLEEIDTAMIDHYHLDLMAASVVCEKCRAVLDLGRKSNRAWVAKYPSRAHSRGYRMNCFSVNTLGLPYVITQLLKYKEKDFIRGFRNTVLGEADDATSNRIGESEIDLVIGSALIREPRLDIPTWVGIDVGQTCHIVIGQGYTIDMIDVVEMFSCHVDELLDHIGRIKLTYWVVGGLIDRHPYEPTADAVRVKSDNLILPCEYRGETELKLILDASEIEIYAQAERTQLLDEVMASVRHKRIRFNGYGNLKGVIKTHLRNMLRQEEPEKKAIWIKVDQQDHFFHAIGFMLSAVKLKRLKEVKDPEQRTAVQIAGVNVAGYNEDIYGRKVRRSTLWLPN